MKECWSIRSELETERYPIGGMGGRDKVWFSSLWIKIFTLNPVEEKFIYTGELEGSLVQKHEMQFSH